ncbi:MAG: nucleotidyl transferase AbiEii/AbiGii toxin family protein [Clostridiales bacterium]|nr:nucleotidyl transferase AbiEii/AbiGii toxin family protein [Clostridiales bacterium]
MRFTNAMQLKALIKNKSAQTGVPPNLVLQTYMMERLLERISLSTYRNNLIIKGGFLVSAMVGIDRRTTMDIDATAKTLLLSRDLIEEVLTEVVSIDADDGVEFKIKNIINIHDVSEYDDFRISLDASFYSIRVSVKLDITTGDTIIPHEIEYSYKLMFEDRTIPVMAYNLNTILSEKIETILSRNVTNSRGRDFYDTYMLLSMNKDTISQVELQQAILIKARERDSVSDIIDYKKHLNNINNSPEIARIWSAYTRNYPYAKGISLSVIIELIAWAFEASQF